MSSEPPKMFPWWGYLEPYVFGVFGALITLLMVVNGYDLGDEVLIGAVVVLGPLTLIAPALGIYGLEHTRRAIARGLFGPGVDRPPRDDVGRDEAARANITNRRGMFAYAIGRAQDIPFEEALGAFMPVRVLISLFMMMSTLVLYVIVMMDSTGTDLLGSSLFLLLLFGFGAGFTFMANLALAYAWRGGVRATTHLVEGRRALVARREAIEASQLGGALSMGAPSDGGGELSMSHAGELTEVAHASARDEDVALDLDAVEGRAVEVVGHAQDA